jgi:hypothetical protein
MKPIAEDSGKRIQRMKITDFIIPEHKEILEIIREEREERRAGRGMREIIGSAIIS